MTALQKIPSSKRKAVTYLVSKLRSIGVQFEVSGGFAVILYGGKRPLRDIDIGISRRHRDEVRNVFRDDMVTDFEHVVDGMFSLYLMKLSVYGTDVDVYELEESYVFSPEGAQHELAQVWRSPTLITYDGISIPVQERESLIEYKSILQRESDILDIMSISPEYALLCRSIAVGMCA